MGQLTTTNPADGGGRRMGHNMTASSVPRTVCAPAIPWLLGDRYGPAVGTIRMLAPMRHPAVDPNPQGGLHR
jgi:hypothetical protein